MKSQYSLPLYIFILDDVSHVFLLAIAEIPSPRLRITVKQKVVSIFKCLYLCHPYTYWQHDAEHLAIIEPFVNWRHYIYGNGGEHKALNLTEPPQPVEIYGIQESVEPRHVC